MIAQGIRAHVDAIAQAVSAAATNDPGGQPDKQSQSEESTIPDSAEQLDDTSKSRGSSFQRFTHLQLGSLVKQTYADLEQSHSADPMFDRFRLRLEEYLNRRFNPGARWVHLRAHEEVPIATVSVYQ